MILILLRRLDRGLRDLEPIRYRGFGRVWKALNKTSNAYVAIKQVPLIINDKVIENEWKVLSKCDSPFVVRYYDVMNSDNELWVCCFIL